jgi:hypothetical protein
LGRCILNKKAKIIESDPVPIFPIPHIAMVLPLITREGEVIGGIEIFTTMDNLREDYLPYFEMMADFITVAIDNLSN